MKILMVSMHSLHFFSWTEQLKNAGHDIYWFDVLDFSRDIEKLSWVNQINGWKNKVNYPARTFIKFKFPKLYKIINQLNDNKIEKAFEKKLLEIQPDVVHSFAMQLSCIPILEVMQKYPTIKWMYSSWGSDMFFSDYLKIDRGKMSEALSRIDCLITDCKRDHQIAIQKGFKNKFMGVFPGNGGVVFNPPDDNQKRNVFLIKGYNLKVGRGYKIIEALTDEVIDLIKNLEIIVYGADEKIVNAVDSEERFKNLNIRVYTKRQFIKNDELIQIMGKSLIHIGNSASDGLPNSLIEAMGMGAFPIQSNPGNVTAELIDHKKNGLLIDNPDDANEISNLIKYAFSNPEMITKAQIYNQNFINDKYNRNKLKSEIIQLYE